MTRPRYGAAIDITDVGDRQSPALPTPPLAPPPIPLRRWSRNGKHPNAELANRINAAANAAALYRSKEVFSICAPVFSGNGSFYVNGDLWHFAFHTGPHTTALFARLAMNVPFASASNSYATVKIYSDASLSTLVASQDFEYGSAPGGGGSPYVWQTLSAIDKFITGISADTDYYGVISSHNNAYVLAASIVDCPSFTESGYGGYLATNYTTHTPILAIDRERPQTLMRDVWKRGGSKVLNWAVTPGNAPAGSDSNGTYRSITTTSATGTNILNLSSTTVSTSTPGWTVDMRFKDRISQSSGVPCVMKAYGRNATGADLNVVLKDSSGATVAAVNGFTGSDSWKSATLNLPATLAKYDIQYFTTVPGARGYLYAVSIWEQE